MSKGTGILLLSTADWDAEIWTNKQHTARALRDAGFCVLYVESQGLRAPRLSMADARRILRRLRRVAARPERVSDAIWRWSPPSIPLQRFGFVRAVNRFVASALLVRWSRAVLGRDIVVWTYNPLTTQLIKLPRHRALVYHCVDDIAVQPGMPTAIVRRYEADLVRRADHVFVSSRTLEARWAKVRHVQYEANAVDLTPFEAAPGADALPTIPHPRVGFVGAIAAYKLDVELLTELASQRKNWQFVLVGPLEAPDATIDALLRHPNVHHTDTVPYEEVPRYMRSFDVGIIPARQNEYTRFMFPMKFFEYLAAGLPVVTTDIPALQEFAEVAQVVPRAEFGNAIERALESGPPDAAARDAIVSCHTYAARTRRMLTQIFASDGFAEAEP